MSNLWLSAVKWFVQVHVSKEDWLSQKATSGLHDSEMCDTDRCFLWPHFATKGKNVTLKWNSRPIPHLWRASVSWSDQARTPWRGKERLLINRRDNRCYPGLLVKQGAPDGHPSPGGTPLKGSVLVKICCPQCPLTHPSYLFVRRHKKEKWAEGKKKVRYFAIHHKMTTGITFCFKRYESKKCQEQCWRSRTYSS